MFLSYTLKDAQEYFGVHGELIDVYCKQGRGFGFVTFRDGAGNMLALFLFARAGAGKRAFKFVPYRTIKVLVPRFFARKIRLVRRPLSSRRCLRGRCFSAQLARLRSSSMLTPMLKKINLRGQLPTGLWQRNTKLVDERWRPSLPCRAVNTMLSGTVPGGGRGAGGV